SSQPKLELREPNLLMNERSPSTILPSPERMIPEPPNLKVGCTSYSSLYLRYWNSHLPYSIDRPRVATNRLTRDDCNTFSSSAFISCPYTPQANPPLKRIRNNSYSTRSHIGYLDS